MKWPVNVNTQIATQEESKNIKEIEETTRKGMDRIESAVREEAQGIKEDLKTTTHNVTNMIEETVCKLKDQLEEMNQSITTLSSSASGSESSGGKFTTQFIVQYYFCTKW